MRRAALFSFYRPQATDARRVSDLAVGLNQFDMADAEGLGQFIECDDGRVPPTALKATEILLAEARALLDLLLGQTAVSTQAREIPANQFTHVHALQDRDLHTLSLSTIICK